MYERFTTRARKVMQLANKEAQRFNHQYIGSEHILLGIVKEGAGVAANVLKNLGIDFSTIQLEVEKIVRSGSDPRAAGKLPLAPGAKKIIEYSIEEARKLKHNYVGTEHVLLALLREEEGIAARVLTGHGLSLGAVGEEVLRLLDHSVDPATAAPSIPPESRDRPLSPQKAEHFTATDRVAELLRNAFGAGYHVRMQGPLELGPKSELIPDVAVVIGTREQYAARHPNTAVLVVEISDETLAFDRTRKAGLYALADIPEYWIVDLTHRVLEVRRGPAVDAMHIYGHGYASLTELVPPATVAPLTLPHVSLPVADLVA